MKYEVGHTYEWDGGECPLPKYAVARLWIRSGGTFATAMPTNYGWGHDSDGGDIVRFKVLELPEPEPEVRYCLLPRMVYWAKTIEEARWPDEVVAEAKFDSAGNYIPGTLREVKS